MPTTALLRPCGRPRKWAPGLLGPTAGGLAWWGGWAGVGLHHVPLPILPTSPPPLPPSPSSPTPRPGDSAAPPPPPPARGCGSVCTACMAGRYAESSGHPSSAPQAAREPQDRPSNQIKSNQINPIPPLFHHHFPILLRLAPPPPPLAWLQPPWLSLLRFLSFFFSFFFFFSRRRSKASSLDSSPP